MGINAIKNMMLLHIFAILLINFIVCSAAFNCPANCDCETKGDTVEVDCLNKFTMSFNLTGKFSNIQCIPPFNSPDLEIIQSYDDHVTMNDLPILNFTENLSSITFGLCPLLPGDSFVTITRRIGGVNVTSLNFRMESPTDAVQLTKRHFLGMEELKELRINRNTLNELPANVFEDLVNLEWLDLSNTNLSYLPIEIFKNSKRLRHLNLNNNEIKSIDGVLKSLTTLKRISLTNNRLIKLNSTTFSETPNLEIIDLGLNQLETLDADSFKYLKNMKIITLDRNYFTSLPEGLFKHNLNLEGFRLLGPGRLRDLPRGLFENLTHLEKVTIESAPDLKTLPEDTFRNATSLKIIEIYKCGLNQIKGNIFASQHQLETLDLSFNKIQFIDDTVFRKLPNLLHLYLAFNKLRVLSESVFSNLNNLQVLDLKQNVLTHIHENALYAMAKLQNLYLEDNQLTLNEIVSSEAITPFNNLKNVGVINLRNNSINIIFYDWMLNNPNLKDLDLSYNNFTSLDQSDLQFANEIKVNLEDNQISEINFHDVNTIKFTKPVRILLDRNPVTCDCNLYDFVKYVNSAASDERLLKIEATNLYCNDINDVGDANILNLELRDLVCPFEAEKEEYCPSACQCYTRPHDNGLIVNCTNTNLTKIPPLPLASAIGRELTELHLENNLLNELPDIHSRGYSEVKEVYAENNRISKLSINNLPSNLSVLKLSNNNLHSIGDNVWKALNKTKKLKKLALAGNPWSCNCKSKTLLSFVQLQYKLISDLDQMKCRVDQRKIGELTFEDICNGIKWYIVLWSTIAVVGILLSTVFAVYYKYQQEIKVWLYAHNMCLWMVTEEELDKDKKYDAFISYSHKDEEFVVEELIRNLESEPNSYKLCIHDRDWVPGEFIANQITTSVAESRRTIIILSTNFLGSEWGKMEFRAAHRSAIDEGRARVIIILYGDIGDIENLDTELKAYLKMNTYVKWGDKYFWNKLRYAMPHTRNLLEPNLLQNNLKLMASNNLIKSSPDNNPSMTTPPASKMNENPLLDRLTVKNECIKFQ